MNNPETFADSSLPFFIREEDWGLVCLVPEENRADVLEHFGRWEQAGDKEKIIRFRSALEMSSRFQSEHIQEAGQSVRNKPISEVDTHITPAERITSPFLILDEKVPISERGIPYTELVSLVQKILPPARLVVTAETMRDPGRKCQNCFALGATGGTALYGTHEHGVLTSMQFQDNPVQNLDRDVLTDALVLLGERYRLILVDWERRRIVELRDHQQVTDYFQTLFFSPGSGIWEVEKRFRQTPALTRQKEAPPGTPDTQASSGCMIAVLILILLVGFLFWLIRSVPGSAPILYPAALAVFIPMMVMYANSMKCLFWPLPVFLIGVVLSLVGCLSPIFSFIAAFVMCAGTVCLLIESWQRNRLTDGLFLCVLAAVCTILYVVALQSIHGLGAWGVL